MANSYTQAVTNNSISGVPENVYRLFTFLLSVFARRYISSFVEESTEAAALVKELVELNILNEDLDCFCEEPLLVDTFYSSSVEGDKMVTITWSEGFNDEIIPIIQWLLGHSTTSALQIEGAYTCDKLRPGEFGGFCYLITRTKVYAGGTSALLKLFLEMASGKDFHETVKEWEL